MKLSKFFTYIRTAQNYKIIKLQVIIKSSHFGTPFAKKQVLTD